MMDIKEELKNFEAHCLQTGQLQVAELQRNSINKINELEAITRGRDELIKNAVSSRIPELENTNDTLHKLMVSGERRGIEKATEESKDKIAELEKERDELKTQLDVLTFENETNHECYVNLLFSNKPTEVNLQAHNLEQQAKGVEDLARESYSGMTAVWMIAYADRLKDEAKALKDQG
jgi:hypothetical protein